MENSSESLEFFSEKLMDSPMVPVPPIDIQFPSATLKLTWQTTSCFCTPWIELAAVCFEADAHLSEKVCFSRLTSADGSIVAIPQVPLTGKENTYMASMTIDLGRTNGNIEAIGLSANCFKGTYAFSSLASFSFSISESSSPQTPVLNEDLANLKNNEMSQLLGYFAKKANESSKWEFVPLKKSLPGRTVFQNENHMLQLVQGTVRRKSLVDAIKWKPGTDMNVACLQKNRMTYLPICEKTLILGTGWTLKSCTPQPVIYMVTSNGKIVDKVFYGHKQSKDKSISETISIGIGEGDDKTFEFNFSMVTPVITQIFIGFVAQEPGQCFSDLKSIYCRFYDPEKKVETIRCEMKTAEEKRGICLARFYRDNEGEPLWKVEHIGDYIQVDKLNSSAFALAEPIFKSYILNQLPLNPYAKPSLWVTLQITLKEAKNLVKMDM